MSTALGNSWHGCKCKPTRSASRISAANVSGSCAHVRALRYTSMWSQLVSSAHDWTSAIWRSLGQMLFSSSASSLAPGLYELQYTLTVDVPLLRLGQQPLAHEYHRAVLQGRDARPLQCTAT
eukprot:4983431-Prymnesium_polylepis.1